jgi:hypothetical protein
VMLTQLAEPPQGGCLMLDLLSWLLAAARLSIRAQGSAATPALALQVSCWPALSLAQALLAAWLSAQEFLWRVGFLAARLWGAVKQGSIQQFDRALEEAVAGLVSRQMQSLHIALCISQPRPADDD